MYLLISLILLLLVVVYIQGNIKERFNDELSNFEKVYYGFLGRQVDLDTPHYKKNRFLGCEFC